MTTEHVRRSPERLHEATKAAAGQSQLGAIRAALLPLAGRPEQISREPAVRPASPAAGLSAVILAAGEGTRLRVAADSPPKPLTMVAGTTLLERALRTCCAVGVSEAIVVVGHRGEPVANHVAALSTLLPLRLRTVRARRWSLGNGASALAARGLVREPFYLLMSDHLIPPAFLEQLALSDDGRRGAALAVDGNLAGIHDLDEATKVRLHGTRVSAIGKRLRTNDAVDTGAFLCRAGLFDALRRADTQGKGSLTDAMQLLVDDGELFAVRVDGHYWHDIDTPEDLAFARARLLAVGAGVEDRSWPSLAGAVEA